MRERRAASTSGQYAYISKATVYFVFKESAVSARRIRVTWEDHAERNYQRVRLGAKMTEFDNDGVITVLCDAHYGPVHGNTISDYTKKAERVGGILGAISAGIVPETFRKERYRVQ
ncbi:MAG TPA: hypothetical protein VIY48_02760 [Candidatus Paceibacterota bacterium]